MAYTLKAEGTNPFALKEETVETLVFENTSSDNPNARARDTYQTISVTGRVRADSVIKDETIGSVKWALVPAALPTAYQKITAMAVAAGQTTRKYEFTQGFVVSYEEEFSDRAGVGAFSIKIRQKKDQLDQVLVSGGYASEL
jgi:hypothetical protein